MKPWQWRLCVGFFAVSFLAAGFVLIGDYGLFFDDPENFGIGHKYLHFYRSGHLDIQDSLPEIESHGAAYYNEFLKSTPFGIWPLANILSAFTCEGFFQKARLLGPVAAHHAIAPLLTALFGVLFYYYGRRLWGRGVSICSWLLLLTLPRFFGEALSNIKDAPLTAFFGIALLAWGYWQRRGRLRDFYTAVFFAACALATKFDAALLFALFGFLGLMQGKRFFARLRGLRWHLAAGLLGAGIFIIFLFPPLWAPGDSRQWFFSGMGLYLLKVGLRPWITWNLYAPIQFFLTAPVLFFFFTLLGLLGLKVVSRRRRYTDILLASWFLLPILRHCLPYANHYDGIRHFLYVLPAAAVISVLGARRAAKFIALRMRRLRVKWFYLLLCAMLLENIWGIAATHPYERTYFSPLVGGLRGAQDLRVPYSFDQWLASFREMAAWLDKNAQPGSRVWVYPRLEHLRYQLTRRDFKARLWDAGDYSRGGYFVFIPYDRSWVRPEVSAEFLEASRVLKEEGFVKAYEIRRQGGVVGTVYFKHNADYEGVR
ncbi:MAG: glycosyltransferase family 39 protein [Candidatus Omnitrophica bacterium]|nr:glycosyltransferase family 39 protein [Candidatus Omnitrophota bacterium]